MKCCKRGLMGDSRGDPGRLGLRVMCTVEAQCRRFQRGRNQALGTRLEATHVIFGKDSSCLLSMFGELA